MRAWSWRVIHLCVLWESGCATTQDLSLFGFSLTFQMKYLMGKIFNVLYIFDSTNFFFKYANILFLVYSCNDLVYLVLRLKYKYKILGNCWMDQIPRQRYVPWKKNKSEVVVSNTLHIMWSNLCFFYIWCIVIYQLLCITRKLGVFVEITSSSSIWNQGCINLILLKTYNKRDKHGTFGWFVYYLTRNNINS